MCFWNLTHMLLNWTRGGQVGKGPRADLGWGWGREVELEVVMHPIFADCTHMGVALHANAPGTVATSTITLVEGETRGIR